MGTKAPGGGKGGNDIRAGGGFWELVLKDRLSPALDKIQARVKSFGAALSKAGTAGMAGGAALGAGPLALLFGGGSRLAQTAQLARQFEVPIAMMGKFQHAAERAGVSVDEVMNDTRGRFRDLLKNAPLVDAREAQAALDIQNQFKDSVHALQDALTPVLVLVSAGASRVAVFVKENAGLVRVLAAAAAGLFTFGAAAKLTGISLMGIVGLVPAAFGGLLSVLGALASPLGLATVAAGALTAKFLSMTDSGRGVLADLHAGFLRLGPGIAEAAETGKKAWGGLVGALKKGDLQLAFEIGAEALRLEWDKVVLFWTESWLKFKGGFLKDLHEIALRIEGTLIWQTAERIGRAGRAAIDKPNAAIDDVLKASAGLTLPDGVGWFASGLVGDVARKAMGAGAVAAPAGPARLSLPAAALAPVFGLDVARGLGAVIGDELNKELAKDPMIRAIEARIAAREARFGELVARGKEGAPTLEGALAGGLAGLADAIGLPDALNAERDRLDALRGNQLRQGLAAAESVKGGFNAANARLQFGLGDKVSVQTELQRQIKDNTAKAAADIAQLVIALRLQ